MLRRVRLSLTLNRWRLGLLHWLKGGTVWTRRGGWWLPFHADGDLQEIQYQLEGEIYAFEPSPSIYAKLLQVVEKNQLRNVQCFNLGCGSVRGRETLLVPASSGNATIRRSGVHFAGACREINIEIDTLDNVILPLAPTVDFLKIDTEGFEDQVLAGADEVIARYRPVVYLELSQEYGDSSARAVAWLRARRYTFERDPDLASAHNGDNFLAIPMRP